MKNGLREADFVLLDPGESFDPYIHAIDSYGFFGAEHLKSRFALRGEYGFTFHYSTASSSIDDWKGSVIRLSDDVLQRLQRVPRINIDCSIELNVSE